MKTYGSAATSWLFNINQQWVFHWCGKYCTHPSKAQRSMFTTLCKVEIFRSLTFVSLSLSTFVYLCLNWKFMIFERPPVPAQGWEFTNCIYNSNHTCFTIVIVIVILLFKIPTTHVSQLLLLLLFCYLKFQPHMFHNCYWYCYFVI